MLFRSSDKKGDVCLVLDIGNASLAGSFVLFEQGKLPQALYTIRVPLSIDEHPHSEKLHIILESELEEVLHTLHTKGFEHAYFKDHEKTIHKVLCVYASPWYVSKTKKVHVSNQKPFFVTKPFLDDVLTKEANLFEQELASGTYGEEFKSGIVLMEKTIVDARINGYSIDNPVGQKTTECDIVMYLGIGSAPVVDMVQGLITRHFPYTAQDIISHTFPLVVQTALQKIVPHEKNYILCDITGEVTDMTCVSDGVVKNTTSFPSGKFFLIRKLMQNLGVPAEVAQSFLHLWQTGNAQEDIETKIQEALLDVEREWSIYLEDALSHLGDIRSLPQKVYITADSDVVHVFMDFLKVSKIDMTALWRKGLLVGYIGEEMLTRFYNSPNHLTFDECIALDSIFLGVFQ